MNLEPSPAPPDVIDVPDIAPDPYPEELVFAVQHAWASDRRALAVIDVVRAYDREMARAEAEESTLVRWATRELERIGWLGEDSDYDGMLGEGVLEVVKVFASQGHSGYSAMRALAVLPRLLAWEPLTDLTDDPGEWMQVEMGDEPCWQSTRCPSAFSLDGGKRYYDVEDPDRITRPTQPAGEEPRPWPGRLA